MIKIYHDGLEKIAREHFEALRSKFDNISYEELEEIILAKPEKLLEVATKYEHHGLKFKNRYDNFCTKKKEYNAYDLANKLQVSVCPYCNENLTYTIIKRKGQQIMRPEFDHFYDKATYPVLSLSFYNLIPCCHICNSTLKHKTAFSLEKYIHPYHDSFDREARFGLQIKNVSFYHDIEGFEIPLKCNSQKAKNSAKVFETQERYNQHKDLILELIQKNDMYPDSYIDELLGNYEGTLFKNKEDLLRLITCGYISEEEIGKRPLSKLIKDISKELGL